MERGIAAARVEEITERAGVAKGTFYLYFDSKDHLVLALRERLVDQLIEQQCQALDRLPPEAFGAHMDLWLEDAIRAYIEHAELHDVLFEHDTAASPIHSGITPENRHIDALRDLLAERADPPAGAPDPYTAAVLVTRPSMARRTTSSTRRPPSAWRRSSPRSGSSTAATC